MNDSWHSPARQSVGFETITVADSAIGLTTASYQAGLACLITVENGPIRYRTDGIDASATIGHLLYDTDRLLIDNPSEMKNLSMFRDGATSGVISVSYYNT